MLARGNLHAYDSVVGYENPKTLINLKFVNIYNNKYIHVHSDKDGKPRKYNLKLI